MKCRGWPGTGTSMKNGYSIVVRRIEKGPFSKDIFSNFTPFLRENKEKSELKFTPFFLQNKDIFRKLTPSSHEIYPIFQIRRNNRLVSTTIHFFYNNLTSHTHVSITFSMFVYQMLYFKYCLTKQVNIVKCP